MLALVRYNKQNGFFLKRINQGSRNQMRKLSLARDQMAI